MATDFSLNSHLNFWFSSTAFLHKVTKLHVSHTKFAIISYLNNSRFHKILSGISQFSWRNLLCN